MIRIEFGDYNLWMEFGYCQIMSFILEKLTSFYVKTSVSITVISSDPDLYYVIIALIFLSPKT
jgi:hypothetical protein